MIKGRWAALVSAALNGYYVVSMNMSISKLSDLALFVSWMAWVVFLYNRGILFLFIKALNNWFNQATLSCLWRTRWSTLQICRKVVHIFVKSKKKKSFLKWLIYMFLCQMNGRCVFVCRLHVFDCWVKHDG